MQNSINIYSYTRVHEADFSVYENVLSNRAHFQPGRSYEFESLKLLVEALAAEGAEVGDYDGFFNSFSIAQIGKEFDLLKISPDRRILNIELKSFEVGEAKILKQLMRNRYYLRHIDANVRLYTFVAESGVVYHLTEDKLERVSIGDLREELKRFPEGIKSGIEAFFAADQFLISPLSSAAAFLNDEYFLTVQQDTIKEEIVRKIRESKNSVGDRVGSKNEKTAVIGITGAAGTGKTLLLYDLAKELSADHRCAIVHCGPLTEEHRRLDAAWEKVDIYAESAFAADSGILDPYDLILLDETLQIHDDSLLPLLSYVHGKQKMMVAAYAETAYFAPDEESGHVVERLCKQEGFVKYTLSDRIRRGYEVLAFFRCLIDRRNQPGGFIDYDNVEIIYAASKEEADRIAVDLIGRKGFALPMDYEVKENLLLRFGSEVYYSEDGILCLRGGEGSEAFRRDLFQAAARTEKQLCILVEDNYELFREVLAIRAEMLERFLYNRDVTDNAVSLKAVNRATKLLKDILRESDYDGAPLISDTIDVINQSITGVSPNEKAVHIGLELLRRMHMELADVGIRDRLADYIDLIEDI